MDKARAFFYVSAGVFLLALTLVLGFHLGARSATAQAGTAVGGLTAWHSTPARLYAITGNGDVYVQEAIVSQGFTRGPEFVGNFWSGPTSVQRETWGQLKARYRGGSGRE